MESNNNNNNYSISSNNNNNSTLPKNWSKIGVDGPSMIGSPMLFPMRLNSFAKSHLNGVELAPVALDDAPTTT